MHYWKIYYENADTDDERVLLSYVTADTMVEALQKASEFYEIPSHDLIAVMEKHKPGDIKEMHEQEDKQA